MPGDGADVEASIETLGTLLEWFDWSSDRRDRDAAYRRFAACFGRKSPAEREIVHAAIETVLRFLEEAGENSIDRVSPDAPSDLDSDAANASPM